MMPSTDLSKLQFLSRHPIDKIVQAGEITIVNSGAQAVSEGNLVNQPRTREVSDTRLNEYGRAGLIRARYSVDGGNNWQDMHAVLSFGYDIDVYVDSVLSQSSLGADIRMQIVVGSDDSTIYFRTISGYHNGDPIRIDVDSGTGESTYSDWSATSQTVIIQYWMFERE